MPFKPGVSGNPKGRRPGVSPAHSKKFLQKIERRDGAFSLPFLIAIAEDMSLPLPFRMQAAGLVLPYESCRKTARPISKPCDLPAPTSVDEATANIAKLGELAARGQIGLDEAGDLANLQKSYVELKLGTEIENRLAAIETALRNHDIRPSIDITVEGGMRDLPGTRIDMPPRTIVGPGDRDRNGDGE